MNYTFTITREDKPVEINLYDIVVCRRYPTYKKWCDQWYYDHAQIEVSDNNGDTKRYILNAEEYFDLINVATMNMDSFGWMFGKVDEKFRK